MINKRSGAALNLDMNSCNAGEGETPLFARFYTKNDHFTKTGSGQT
jgi:hypothetical protein